jgi:hypothetical protein
VTSQLAQGSNTRLYKELFPAFARCLEIWMRHASPHLAGTRRGRIVRPLRRAVRTWLRVHYEYWSLLCRVLQLYEVIDFVISTLTSPLPSIATYSTPVEQPIRTTILLHENDLVAPVKFTIARSASPKALERGQVTRRLSSRHISGHEHFLWNINKTKSTTWSDLEILYWLVLTDITVRRIGLPEILNQ